MNYTAKLFQRLKSFLTLASCHLLGQGRAIAPLNILFMLTLDCNLKCEGCFIEMDEDHDRKTGAGEKTLTADEIKSIIDSTPFFSILSFSGGEPLLRKDSMKILEYASYKRRCHLITNGSLISGNRAAKLVELGAKNIFGRGLLVVGVSISGLGKTHDHIVKSSGSFEKTIDAINAIQRIKREKNVRFPLLDLKLVMREECVHQLSDICSLAGEMGVDIVSYQILLRQSFPNYSRSGASMSSSGDEFQSRFPTPVNFSSLNTLEKELKKIGKMREAFPFMFRFVPNMPISRIVKYYAGEFLLKDYQCTSPWTTMIINHKGDVTPCLGGYKPSNLRHHTFWQCWNSAGLKKLRKDLGHNGIRPACVGCCMLEYNPRQVVNSNHVISSKARNLRSLI